MPNRGSMKKGIIVLLITVLAAGMAFAGVTGKAATQFTFNLDEGKGYGFGDANPQEMKYTFSFQIDAATVDKADHQTDIWAEIGAEAKASIATKNAKEKGDLTAKIDTLKLTKANIHINNITIDILGPQGFFDYASSFTTKKYGSYTGPCFDMTSDDPLFGTSVDAGGVNVLYDGYTFAFAFNNKVTAKAKDTELSYGDLKWYKDKATALKADEDNVLVVPTPSTGAEAGYYAVMTSAATGAAAKENMVLYVGAETKAYELAEGATLQAAANFNLNRDMKTEKNAFAISGSVNADYEADKLAAGFAVDGRLNIAEDETKKVAMDVLANAKYDILNGAVYFGTDNLGKEGAEYLLEAKVGADIPVAEEIVLKVAGEVDGLYLEKADAFKNAAYKASVGTSVDKLTVGAEFGWNVGINFNTKGEATKYGMKIAANASYALEVATIKGSASVNFIPSADKVSFYAIRPAVSVESSAIVENCTLSLGWSGASFEADDFASLKTDSNGKIVAAATIAF